jgi:hypothetical protein
MQTTQQKTLNAEANQIGFLFSIDFKNLISMLHTFMPVILVGLFCLISVINQDIRGFVYFSGICMSLMANVPILHQFKDDFHSKNDSDQTCNIMNVGSYKIYSTPAMNSIIYGFTIAYMTAPMFLTNVFNYSFISFLLSICILDSYMAMRKKCNKIRGILIGIFSGIASGLLWFSALRSAGMDNLLFAPNSGSNKVYCKRPTDNLFVCKPNVI